MIWIILCNETKTSSISVRVPTTSHSLYNITHFATPLLQGQCLVIGSPNFVHGCDIEFDCILEHTKLMASSTNLIMSTMCEQQQSCEQPSGSRTSKRVPSVVTKFKQSLDEVGVKRKYAIVVFVVSPQALHALHFFLQQPNLKLIRPIHSPISCSCCSTALNASLFAASILWTDRIRPKSSTTQR